MIDGFCFDSKYIIVMFEVLFCAKNCLYQNCIKYMETIHKVCC